MSYALDLYIPVVPVEGEEVHDSEKVHDGQDNFESEVEVDDIEPPPP